MKVLDYEVKCYRPTKVLEVIFMLGSACNGVVHVCKIHSKVPLENFAKWWTWSRYLFAVSFVAYT